MLTGQGLQQVPLSAFTKTVSLSLFHPGSFTNSLLPPPLNGWGHSSFGRASDQHATGAGSISWCSTGFFSQHQLSRADSLMCVHTSPCANACIDIYVRVKDPVVHVRVRWIMETLKYPACAIGQVVQLSRLAFPGESNLNFPWENSQQDKIVVIRL